MVKWSADLSLSGALMRHRSIPCSKLFVPLALMLGVSLAGTNVVSAQQFTLISSASDGTPANGISLYPSISKDGRFVAFESAPRTWSPTTPTRRLTSL
jgi:hypothetical protein